MNKFAFPTFAMSEYGEGMAPEADGMTYRQYVAAKALEGLLANTSITGALSQVNEKPGVVIAKMAVDFTDALIAELEKTDK